VAWAGRVAGERVLGRRWNIGRGVAPREPRAAVVRKVGLYMILFYFTALLWESFIRLCPPHLQNLPYCNTIARPLRNVRPPTDPPFVCQAPYNIGDGNIV